MNDGIRDKFLLALSRVYGAVTSARNDLYDKGIFKSYKSEIPVISIGNITAGGNAKTPLAIVLLNELHILGMRPALLTRGYGGTVKGPYLVNDTDSAHKVGDEALLIHQKTNLPVIVSPNRAKGAIYIKEHNLADVIVMDDGFQHRALARNVDIVSIDVGSKKAVDDFLAGKLLPLGRFRENRERALMRSSVVVFSFRCYLKEPPKIDPRLLELIPNGIPTFVTTVEPKGISALVGDGKIDSSKKIVAFCAIAKPERFFDTLESMGIRVEAKESFHDHHRFTSGDITMLRAKYPDASFICTEKDAVKLLEGNLEGIFKLEIDTVIHDKEHFVESVLNRIK